MDLEFLETQKKEGYSIMDMVTQMSEIIVSLEISAKSKSFVLQKLADVEYRLSIGCDEKLNIGAIVSAFQFLQNNQ